MIILVTVLLIRRIKQLSHLNYASAELLYMLTSA